MYYVRNVVDSLKSVMKKLQVSYDNRSPLELSISTIVYIPKDVKSSLSFADNYR